MTPEFALVCSIIVNTAVDFFVILVLAAILAGGEDITNREIARLKKQLSEEKINRRELELAMHDKFCDLMEHIESIEDRFTVDQNEGTITFRIPKDKS